MKRNLKNYGSLAAVFTALLLGAVAGDAWAGSDVVGLVHTNGSPGDSIAIDLAARCDFISTADGNSILIWGYGEGTTLEDARAQYPGPTLIVDEGDTITINLHNWITDETGALIGENTSLMVHGFSTTATGGVPGALAREAEPGGSVSYTFTADRPGTYLYESGTEAWLQVEMGLFGALIVRPTGAGFDQLPGPNDTNGYATSVGYAYDDASSAFHREYLFLLSEMDPIVHDMVEFGQKDQIANHEYYPVYWFINGRVGPDTLAANNVFYLPTQPYSIVPRMLPGEKLLMRMVGASRDMHPYHHHGNHARVIAKDGHLLDSGAGGADLSYLVFTIQTVPGETTDAIFEWTGEEMGWDIYAHTSNANCNDADSDGFADPDNPGDAMPWEYCADHGKPIPVALPENQNLAFGGFWSGSPYLGAAGNLPPGEGGLNPYAGYFFMWHSHTEKELTNFDIFPGGMMTMLAVEPPGTTDIP